MAPDHKEISALVTGYVEEGKSDYVGLWQICSKVKKEFHPEDPVQLKNIVLQTVREMLASGLVAVDLASSGSGCTPWKEQMADAVIRRISTEWDSLGRDPSVGDIVWFNNPS